MIQWKNFEKHPQLASSPAAEPQAIRSNLGGVGQWAEVVRHLSGGKKMGPGFILFPTSTFWGITTHVKKTNNILWTDFFLNMFFVF